MKENVKKKGSLPHYKYNRETTSYEYSEKRDDEESSSGEEVRRKIGHSTAVIISFNGLLY